MEERLSGSLAILLIKTFIQLKILEKTALQTIVTFTQWEEEGEDVFNVETDEELNSTPNGAVDTCEQKEQR